MLRAPKVTAGIRVGPNQNLNPKTQPPLVVVKKGRLCCVLLTVDGSNVLLVCPGQDLLVQSLSVFELALLQVARCLWKKSRITNMCLVNEDGRF